MSRIGAKRFGELRHYAHLMRIHGRPEEQIGLANKIGYYLGLLLDPATASPELAKQEYKDNIRWCKKRKAESNVGIRLVSAPESLIRRLSPVGTQY